MGEGEVEIMLLQTILTRNVFRFDTIIVNFIFKIKRLVKLLKRTYAVDLTWGIDAEIWNVTLRQVQQPQRIYTAPLQNFKFVIVNC